MDTCPGPDASAGSAGINDVASPAPFTASPAPGSSRCPGSRAPSVRNPSSPAMRCRSAYASESAAPLSSTRSTARPCVCLEFWVHVTTGPGVSRPCANSASWRAWLRNVSATCTSWPVSSRMRDITRASFACSSGSSAATDWITVCDGSSGLAFVALAVPLVVALRARFAFVSSVSGSSCLSSSDVPSLGAFGRSGAFGRAFTAPAKRPANSSGERSCSERTSCALDCSVTAPTPKVAGEMLIYACLAVQVC